MRVLVSDDHEIVLAGLEKIISEIGGEVVGKALNGFELFSKVEELNPDIVIVDFKMPGFGISELKELNKKLPNKVIVLTAISERELLRQILDIGVAGLVSKESALEDIQFCIKSVGKNKKFVSPDFLTLLFTEKNLNGSIDCLTQREIEVLKYLAEGHSNRKIAKILNLSTRTIDSHRSNILKKLNARSNQDLVKFALKHHLIELN